MPLTIVMQTRKKLFVLEDPTQETPTDINSFSAKKKTLITNNTVHNCRQLSQTFPHTGKTFET